MEDYLISVCKVTTDIRHNYVFSVSQISNFVLSSCNLIFCLPAETDEELLKFMVLGHAVACRFPLLPNTRLIDAI